jgi:transcriptional regulator with XRE-family HTH domain
MHGDDTSTDSHSCPFCQESINPLAIKCRFCSEFIPPAVEQWVARLDAADQAERQAANERQPHLNGDRITELREAKGITREQLASTTLIGIDAATRAENSDATIDEKVVNRIASGLGVDPSAFYRSGRTVSAASAERKQLVDWVRGRMAVQVAVPQGATSAAGSAWFVGAGITIPLGDNSSGFLDGIVEDLGL